MLYPMKPGTYTEASPFGSRINPVTGQRETHNGLDFAADKGTPFYAAADGIVVEGTDRANVDGFGRWVWIDCQDSVGYDLIYGHGDPAVKKGDRVKAGNLVGYVNTYGQSTGPHLHFETWTPPGRVGGSPVDPKPLLAGYPGQPAAPVSYFADVSEFQTVLDDRYPHRILIIRSNDGDYRDRNFQQNYAKAVKMLDSGKLDLLGVYFYWRSNWDTCVNVHASMVGAPHPHMFSMIDVESGSGNEHLGDVSTQLNATRDALTRWLGNSRRVIAYANKGDFASMWPARPADLRVIGAGYPDDPQLPGQIAHQYTDGAIAGGGPLGAAPFGNCDMNKTTLTVADFATAVGIALPGGKQVAKTDSDRIKDTREQLAGYDPSGNEDFVGWPQLGNRTVVNALAAIGEALKIPGFKAPAVKQ